jgi:hypothetical protein
MLVDYKTTVPAALVQQAMFVEPAPLATLKEVPAISSLKVTRTSTTIYDYKTAIPVASQ